VWFICIGVNYIAYDLLFNIYIYIGFVSYMSYKWDLVYLLDKIMELDNIVKVTVIL